MKPRMACKMAREVFITFALFCCAIGMMIGLACPPPNNGKDTLPSISHLMSMSEYAIKVKILRTGLITGDGCQFIDSLSLPAPISDSDYAAEVEVLCQYSGNIPSLANSAVSPLPTDPIRIFVDGFGKRGCGGSHVNVGDHYLLFLDEDQAYQQLTNADSIFGKSQEDCRLVRTDNLISCTELPSTEVGMHDSITIFQSFVFD